MAYNNIYKQIDTGYFEHPGLHRILLQGSKPNNYG